MLGILEWRRDRSELCGRRHGRGSPALCHWISMRDGRIFDLLSSCRLRPLILINKICGRRQRSPSPCPPCCLVLHIGSFYHNFQKATSAHSPTLLTTPISHIKTMKSATAAVATLFQTVWAQNPSCPPPPIASKVKVQSTTGAPLTIRELRIFSDSINVAIGKNATQSSDLDGTTEASKAVDGRWRTYSSTGEGCAKWLEVDLNEPVPIDKVLIVNRKCSDNQACGCQLSYATVSLLDTNGDWVASKVTQDTCNKGWVGFPFKKKCPTAAPAISGFPSLSPSSASSQNPSELPSSTPSLSSQPSICPVTNAVFDSDYGVPRCEYASNSCDTGSLVVGRGNMGEVGAGTEPNFPNT